jgi:uncharacterized protein (TIGR02646 family)
MRQFKRGEKPPVLTGHGDAWGKEWEKRQKAGGKFYWRQVGGQPVNQLLVPKLAEQTQGHCSFCDAYPVSPPSLATVEHFRPKSQFPLLAFVWDNLYYCCDFCQNQKLEMFDEKLLRPDASDYRFDDYFRWNFLSGELELNLDASHENQDRARITIRLYGLNIGHPTVRRLERDKIAATSVDNHDDYPYRNFLFQGERTPLTQSRNDAP